jgi:hypothetical protein
MKVGNTLGAKLLSDLLEGHELNRCTECVADRAAQQATHEFVF